MWAWPKMMHCNQHFHGTFDSMPTRLVWRVVVFRHLITWHFLKYRIWKLSNVKIPSHDDPCIFTYVYHINIYILTSTIHGSVNIRPRSMDPWWALTWRLETLVEMCSKVDQKIKCSKVDQKSPTLSMISSLFYLLWVCCDGSLILGWLHDWNPGCQLKHEKHLKKWHCLFWFSTRKMNKRYGTCVCLLEPSSLGGVLSRSQKNSDTLVQHEEVQRHQGSRKGLYPLDSYTIRGELVALFCL